MKNLLLFSIPLIAVACNENSDKESLSFNIQPKSSSSIEGELQLKKAEKKGVIIEGTISGLKPNSSHGFHIHEKADCSSDDAKSAGGHFSPDMHKHGSPGENLHHFGDLGNIAANEKGVANVNVFIKSASLDKDKKYSLINRAIVVHAGMDDLKSQPSGAAGKRIGCIEIKS